MIHSYIVAIGSNIEPEKYTQKALSLLKKDCKIIAVSSFIKTKPVGYTKQADFLNGAVYLESPLNVLGFKIFLKNIEKKLNRKKSSIKAGPRTIDLDITAINDKIVDEDFYTKSYIQEPVLELIKKSNIPIVIYPYNLIDTKSLI